MERKWPLKTNIEKIIGTLILCKKTVQDVLPSPCKTEPINFDIVKKGRLIENIFIVDDNSSLPNK